MKNLRRIAFVIGTRPEAIKMAPVIAEFKKQPDFETLVVNTGQHRELVKQVLQDFEVQDDFNLDVMLPNQTLSGLTSRVIERFTSWLIENTPERVFVHGDTSTAFAASLASFYLKIPVSHVEAGLRTYDMYSPFPEEMNRTFIDIVADQLFAPTEGSKANLIASCAKPENITVTGNTVIDALYSTVTRIKEKGFTPAFLNELPPLQRESIEQGNCILVTAHRRESFGAPFRDLCQGIRKVAEEHPNLVLIYPVHPNPEVQKPVNEFLTNVNNIALCKPVDYVSLCYLLDRCKLVLSDSGGLQEEASALGKGIVILRETTERPEVLSSGWGTLAGTNPNQILEQTKHWLSGLQKPTSGCPFGDGTASKKILERVRSSK